MGSNDNGGKNPSLHHHHHHCGGGAHHHHHLFYVSPHCPLHHPILQPQNHSPSCSLSLQNPQPYASIPPDPQLTHLHTHPNQSFNDAKPSYSELASMDARMVEDVIEKVEDEEEGDPMFVLTDEWRDFFAKSEAKRRLAKKHAKKGKK